MADKLLYKRNRLNDAFRKFINPSIPNLKFEDKEINYISSPYDSRFRNKWLASVNDIKHICDAYACIGGDTIQYMAIKPRAIINAVQIVDIDNSILTLRFDNLKYNIDACSHLNSNVSIHAMAIKDFILNSMSFNSVDFLYCDPPWTDLNDIWYDCLTLVSNLNNDIIEPLIIKNYNPKYICFKVPFNWSNFKIILEKIPLYDLHRSFKFHFNGYWIHIIKCIR